MKDFFSILHKFFISGKRLRDSILSPIFHSYIFAMYKMNHYGFSRKSIWKNSKHFLEVLKVDYNCSLADVCRDQHTTLGGMSSLMSRRAYSVKQAKADVVRDYYMALNPPDRQLLSFVHSNSPLRHVVGRRV